MDALRLMLKVMALIAILRGVAIAIACAVLAYGAWRGFELVAAAIARSALP